MSDFWFENTESSKRVSVKTYELLKLLITNTSISSLYFKKRNRTN